MNKEFNWRDGTIKEDCTLELVNVFARNCELAAWLLPNNVPDLSEVAIATKINIQYGV
jgi:hypothetical protein